MSYKDNKFQRRRQWERRKHRGNAKHKTSFGAARLRITPKQIPTSSHEYATSIPAVDEMGVAKNVDKCGVYVAAAMFLLMFGGLVFGVAWAIFS